jgi:hypothetical protein
MVRCLWAMAAAAASVTLTVTAGSASARIAGYGPAPSRACLAARGAFINALGDPATATLTAAERRNVVSAVVSPKGASSPLFLYLAFGRDAASARSLVARVGRHLLAPPTAANSVSGSKLNAAWLIESSVGAHPPASATSLVTGCLRAGSLADGAPPLTLRSVTDCMTAHDGAPLDRKTRSRLLPPLPPTIVSHLAAAIVPGDNTGSGQGVFAFVLIGRDRRDSAALRDKLAALLRETRPVQSSGFAHNAAWLTTPTPHATRTQLKNAQRIFEGCLA